MSGATTPALIIDGVPVTLHYHLQEYAGTAGVIVHAHTGFDALDEEGHPLDLGDTIEVTAGELVLEVKARRKEKVYPTEVWDDSEDEGEVPDGVWPDYRRHEQ